ncbi:hypothetical protein K490DRAFT_55601 [Saccharata proteae CBS 121410]|uniref:Uncharacterized protein n=1 Tax=Saccharata proteae CBS 121410 TaxID=1314787 RepID=A0A6A5YBH6_9PEZI|nr:hypothetical protein K490DRAFT_55601 [Saccharata proteae CBS 121410]
MSSTIQTANCNPGTAFEMPTCDICQSHEKRRGMWLCCIGCQAWRHAECATARVIMKLTRAGGNYDYFCKSSCRDAYERQEQEDMRKKLLKQEQKERREAKKTQQRVRWAAKEKTKQETAKKERAEAAIKAEAEARKKEQAKKEEAEAAMKAKARAAKKKAEAEAEAKRLELLQKEGPNMARKRKRSNDASSEPEGRVEKKSRPAASELAGKPANKPRAAQPAPTPRPSFLLSVLGELEAAKKAWK